MKTINFTFENCEDLTVEASRVTLISRVQDELVTPEVIMFRADVPDLERLRCRDITRIEFHGMDYVVPYEPESCLLGAENTLEEVLPSDGKLTILINC